MKEIKEVKIKTIDNLEPPFNFLITTAWTYSEEECYIGSIYHSEQVGRFKDYQVIVSLGERVKSMGFKVGDLIKIDFTKYIIPEQKRDNSVESTVEGNITSYTSKARVIVPVIELGDKDYLYITDNAINGKITEYTEYTNEELKASKTKTKKRKKANLILPNTEIML